MTPRTDCSTPTPTRRDVDARARVELLDAVGLERRIRALAVEAEGRTLTWRGREYEIVRAALHGDALHDDYSRILCHEQAMAFPETDRT